MTEPKTEKEKFLCDEFEMFSWNGAVQRGYVYREDLPDNCDEKITFRKDITELCNKILPVYKNKKISKEYHFGNIEKLAKCIESHKKILREPYYKIGIAQKLLNLRLKYLWCAGKSKKPRHCPIDGKILNHVKWKGKSWTQWECIDEYKDAIAQIKENTYGEHLADWELRTFNKIR